MTTHTCGRPQCNRPAPNTVTFSGDGTIRSWVLRLCDVHAARYLNGDPRPGVDVTVVTDPVAPTVG